MNDDKLKVIITGATSFIGNYIVKEYLKNGHSVTAIVRPNSANINRLPSHPLLKIVELDIDRIEEFSSSAQEEQYNLFYHLAWDGIRGAARDDHELQQRNYKNSIKAMALANSLKCTAFIGAGSQAEYGNCKGRIHEKNVAQPITEYGKAKLQTCNELMRLAANNHMRFIWTRIFSVYGIYDYEKTLVMSTLKKMLRDEVIQLTKCTQMWDYIYVEDAARAMYLLGTTQSACGIYNIASGESKPLKEFVYALKNITRSKSELRFGAVPYANANCVSIEPSVDRLRNELDWKCGISFEQGIKKITEQMKMD